MRAKIGAVRRVLACGVALGAVTALGACGDPEGSETFEAMDIVIENGTVVDGTGSAGYVGDVGIRGYRIAAVTREGGLADVEADERIDATG